MLQRIAAFTIVAGLVASPASAGDRRSYQQGGIVGTEEIHFVDLTSLRRSGSTVTGWMVSVPANGTAKGKPVKFEQYRMTWDCRERRAQLNGFVTYGEDETTLEHRNFPYPTWIHLPPGSVGETNLQAACGESSEEPMEFTLHELVGLGEVMIAAQAALSAAQAATGE